MRPTTSQSRYNAALPRRPDSTVSMGPTAENTMYSQNNAQNATLAGVDILEDESLTVEVEGNRSRSDLDQSDVSLSDETVTVENDLYHFSL